MRSNRDLSLFASLASVKGKRDSARPIHQCYSRNPRLSSFRREGGDDFFEAWIAAERIPERQFQVTIAKAAWTADDAGKLFAGEIFVTNPRSDHGQILDHVRAIH